MERDITKLQKEIEDIIVADDLVNARKFLIQINQWLKENPQLNQTDPEIYSAYKDSIVKLSFVLLSTLRDEEIINLFQNHLTNAFEMFEFDPFDDIVRKLKIILIRKFAFEERDKFKRNLAEALLKNNQIFLKLRPELKQKTIEEWLRGYISVLGAGVVDKLKMIEYLNKLAAENRLSTEQKDKLLKLFNLFEFLKQPSFSPEGLEEFVTTVDEKGNLKIYEKGREIILGKRREFKTPSIVGEEAKKTEYEGVEEEVEQIKEEAPAEVTKSISYDQAIKNTIKKANLSFTDEILENRFKNIVISYLKDVRDEIETRTVLKRPQKIGGMEYDEAKVDEIIKVLKEQKPRVKPEAKPIPEKASLAEGVASPTEIVGKPEVHPDVGAKVEEIPIPPETLPKAKPVTEEIKKEEEKNKLEVEQEVKESASEVKQKFEMGPLSAPIKEEKVEEKITTPEEIKKIAEEAAKAETPPLTTIPEVSLEETPTPGPVSEEESRVPGKPASPKESQFPTEETSIQIRRPPLESTRPTIEEIKTKPRIYGPIDELRIIKIDDWRRWGSAKEAANHILDKINLLAEESIFKKAQGIRAWKESEVNKLYLDIGTEAINSGKSVEEVIKSRQIENKPTLTLEEFNAIAELNQKLRF